MLLATVVETKDLWRTVVASVIAGIGVTFAYSLMVFGATRWAELRRDDRNLLAGAAVGLAALAFLIVAGSIVLGIVVMARK
jgi:inner membrane protein involved in colicin E2 resistance